MESAEDLDSTRQTGWATTDNGYAGSAQRPLLSSVGWVCVAPAPPRIPPWQTVYWYWQTWRKAGVWEQIHTILWRKARRLAGRRREPRGCILDSQSVKTAERGGVHGYMMRARSSMAANGLCWW